MKPQNIFIHGVALLICSFQLCTYEGKSKVICTFSRSNLFLIHIYLQKKKLDYFFDMVPLMFDALCPPVYKFINSFRKK